MILTYPIFIISFIFALFVSASDHLSLQDDAQNIASPYKISEEELIDDLKNKNSVRFQILSNLKQSFYAPSTQLLRYPVLCIGTGRNIQNMKNQHVRVTLIRKCDKSVDIMKCLEADHKEDGFNISDLSTKYGQESFGSVFFAHVNALPPLDHEAELNRSLQIYLKLLVEGGILIYNSSVSCNYLTIDHIVRTYKKADFRELKASWRKAFSKAGFTDIEISIKDEPEFGTRDLGYSFLIIARKPVSSEHAWDVKEYLVDFFDQFHEKKARL